MSSSPAPFEEPAARELPAGARLILDKTRRELARMTIGEAARELGLDPHALFDLLCGVRKRRGSAHLKAKRRAIIQRVKPWRARSAKIAAGIESLREQLGTAADPAERQRLAESIAQQQAAYEQRLAQEQEEAAHPPPLGPSFNVDHAAELDAGQWIALAEAARLLDRSPVRLAAVCRARLWFEKLAARVMIREQGGPARWFIARSFDARLALPPSPGAAIPAACAARETP